MIIAASDYIHPREPPEMRPKMLTFKPDNEADEMLEYRVGETDGVYDFHIDRL